ncbi:DUF397 domain-containing protein [Streptomyces lonarensis]|uniref:DUF397 domain-containing protein n=1 Tax=Streptomyces lonarensis TaxID=700599 RepID=A0A7X6CWT1_9ACTN|nr:DUF397 domain-containing protein [Streptomyces lonarensis]NJQ04027.1 DUF397 domain-containing protein [Streptomyces lonarensis]
MSELTGRDAVDLAGVTWRTSSYTANAGNCVEVGSGAADYIAVRDTKDRGRAPARASHAAWCAFMAATKSGAFS